MQEGKMSRQFTWKDEKKRIARLSDLREGLMGGNLTDGGRTRARHKRPKWSASDGETRTAANGSLAATFLKISELLPKNWREKKAKKLYGTH